MTFEDVVLPDGVDNVTGGFLIHKPGDRHGGVFKLSFYLRILTLPVVPVKVGVGSNLVW